MHSSLNSPMLTYSDSNGEHVFTLKPGPTSIGRSSDRDLILSDSFVSRLHAIIRNEDGKCELTDQNSVHGTFLNGIRVRQAILKSGDTVQIGSERSTKIRFLLNTEDTNRRPAFPVELLTALTDMIQSAGAARPIAREIEQLNFLLSAARKLNSVGAITDILHVLLKLTVDLTGVERGFVFLDSAQGMQFAAGLMADGTIVEGEPTLSRQAIRRAIESQATFIVTDTLTDKDAAGWDSVMAHAIRSIYCIPLRRHLSSAGQDHLIGVLYLDSHIGPSELTEMEHQVLDTIATDAATLLDNALLAEGETKARAAAEELAIAATIHSNFMSTALPKLSYIELDALSVPCLAIGGDFYDAVAVENDLYVVIADVSGKGVAASIVAATLQGVIHAQMLARQSLGDIATVVNQFLCTRRVGKYATLILLKIHPDGLVQYLNCGHVPPIVVERDRLYPLEESNLIVGLIAEAEYKESELRLASGDRILLVTDGITEAEDQNGAQFGDVEFQAIARTCSLGEIIKRVKDFQFSSEALDDWTLVDLHYDADPL